MVVNLDFRDFLRHIVKESELLAAIHSDALQAGRNGITDKEIDAEIAAYRRTLKKKNTPLRY